MGEVAQVHLMAELVLLQTIRVQVADHSINDMCWTTSGAQPNQRRNYMKSVKRFVFSFLFVGILFSSTKAHAGIPVIDAAALIEAVMQVVSWIEQADQMVEQIDTMGEQLQQAQQQYQSATGTRNLGDIFNNKQLQGVVPTHLKSVYGSINSGGYNSLTSDAKTLRSANMIYNCADRTGDSKTMCEAILNTPYQNQAYQQNALDLTQQRVTQIQSLQDSISTTQDPKAIAELQARIQAENVQVSNDANRIALMQAMAASQQQAAQQADHERVLKMLAKDTPSSLDSFVYQMP